ncbi:MAG: PilZ domain-containing protein [Myxococcales bacterium]|nr:PilZ domain-containing protein [Myxococcales bacterium]
MEDFFHSVSDAFARNRESSTAFEWVFLLLALSVVALQVISIFQRRRSVHLEVETLAQQRGITNDELELVFELSRVASVPPMDFLTHPDVFERATVGPLNGTVETTVSGDALATTVRRIRHALHFDRLPSHAPLLTTRELSVGMALDCGEGHGQVVEVSERSFTVGFRPPLAPVSGETLTLTLRHAREATYELRCRVLRGHNTSIDFAHDEMPKRVQLREYVRVDLYAPVTLKALSWPGHALETREAKATLRDLSGGGALVASAVSFPAGVHLSLSFTAGGETFSALGGVVLSSLPYGNAVQLRVEFTTVTPAQRERLFAAVAKVQLEQAAATRTA